MNVDDFLAAGPLIEQRIRDNCPSVTHVKSAADLEGVQEKHQATPAGHVLYVDYTVSQTQAAGERGRFTQTWAVVLVERNVSQRGQAQAQRAAIGPLVAEVLRALMGWRPSNEYSALVPTDPPFQTAYSNGFIYVPLAFTTDLKIAGDPR